MTANKSRRQDQRSRVIQVAPQIHRSASGRVGRPRPPRERRPGSAALTGCTCIRVNCIDGARRPQGDFQSLLMPLQHPGADRRLRFWSATTSRAELERPRSCPRRSIPSTNPAGQVPRDAALRRVGTVALLSAGGSRKAAYRHSRAYPDAGVDLGDFYTTAQDLRENPVEDFLCHRPGAWVRDHAGRRPPPASTPCTSRAARHGRLRTATAALGLYNLGVRALRTAWSTRSITLFWNAAVHAAGKSVSIGWACFHVTAAKIPPAEFYDRVKGYNFNVMFVEPSWLVVLTEIARVREHLRSVKLFFCGGVEHERGRPAATSRTPWKRPSNVLLAAWPDRDVWPDRQRGARRRRWHHIDDLNLHPEIYVEPGD